MNHVALYRLYDAEDTLLYVGVSVEPFRRMTQHAAEQAWWGTVARTTIETFPDREAALTAEREAICTEQPHYNVIHGPQKRRNAKPYEGHRFADAMPDLAERLRALTAEREAVDVEWRESIRAAVADGGSLREVAALANVSHMAVKFIAHGRPDR